MEHLVDPTQIVENDFVLTAGTTMGVRTRPCPCCKKTYKVERLGEHVKKYHKDFWLALFTVGTLQASIEDKALVKCTIAENDHDQKFLICLACDSIRTTDRDHFKKNGEVHSNQHYEACTKMIAEKQGVAYVPKSKTDMEKILAQLDKYKRKAALCDRDHSDLGALICDKEDAEQMLEQIRIGKMDLEDGMKKHVKKADEMRKMFGELARLAREATKHIPGGAGADKIANHLNGITMFAAQCQASI
jgi:hypothetical protein